jgi:hypothetical protein
MADSTTTGSIIAGINNGLGNGVYPSGTYAIKKPELYYCIYAPNNYVTHRGGSDIAWASSTGSFFISQGNPGGSTWKALATS